MDSWILSAVVEDCVGFDDNKIWTIPKIRGHISYCMVYPSAFTVGVITWCCVETDNLSHQSPTHTLPLLESRV